MPLLSVITAGYASKADYLPETIDSLLAQRLPAGWELEWIFQEDGYSPSLRELAARVPQVRYQANDQPLGIAATRNLALTRARGDLIRILDHDDVLLDGALARPVQLWTDRPRRFWLISGADDLDHVGVRSPGPQPDWHGDIARGRLGVVTDSVGRWSVYCAGLTVRADLVQALGGWVASPRSEDVGLLTALAELSDGYLDVEVSWLYRRHAAQTHLGDDWQAREAQAERLVAQRLAAIRQLRIAVAAADD